jgi:RHS repeat-associated protein
MNVYYEYGAPNTGNQSGRLVAQQDASGMQLFFYGDMGELIKNVHTFVVPAGEDYTFATEWEYDSWNRLVKIQYPDGEDVFYEYDNGGKLYRMTGEKNNIQYTYIDNVQYDHFESRSLIEYGNGTHAEYTYHPQNRRLTNLKSYELSSLLMQDIDYYYDNAGNITGTSNNGDFVAGNTGGVYYTSYSYDDLYRLTSSNGIFFGHNNTIKGFDLSMSYSASGNILNKTQNAETLINGNAINVSYNHDYDYSNLPHAPTQVGDWSFDWDLNGNMLRKSGEYLIRTHCWDEENRLTAVHDAGDNEFGSLAHLSAYLYDAGGERVWKLTGRVGDMKLSGKTMYSSVFFDKTLYASPYMVVTDQEYTKHYYIEGERVCTKIGGGFWGTAPMMPNDNALQFMQGDEHGVSGLISEMVGRNIHCAEYYGGWDINPVFAHLGNKANMAEYNQYFYHSDHLGSASFITDATGYVDQHIQYLPFGELFISQRNSTFDSRYKFTAKELDNETNYTYFGARYYDSDLSIWLSVWILSAINTPAFRPTCIVLVIR